MSGAGREEDRGRALFYRIASSAFLIPLIAVFVYLGGWALFVLGLLVAGLAAYEFCTIVRHAGQRPMCVATVLLALLLLTDAQFTLLGLTLPGGVEVARLALSAAIVFSLVWLVLRSGDAHQALTSWAFLFAGALYIGWLLRYYLLLRGLEAHLPALAFTVGGATLVCERGAVWLLVVMVATWLCDTVAYFVGSAIGRRRLLPRISPKKTWEGTIAGLLAAMAGGCLATLLLGLSLSAGVGLGLTIGVAAVLGDLSESLIKRGADVKDASHLIPGHGGLLDRLDSMLFSGVAAYYYLVLTQAAAL